MKRMLIIPLTLCAMLSISAASAQSLGQQPTVPGAGAGVGTPGTGSLSGGAKASLYSAAAGTQSTMGVYGGAAGQNTMLSHNKKYRARQRHTDANNPYLHPQLIAAPGGVSNPGTTPAGSQAPATTGMPAR